MRITKIDIPSSPPDGQESIKMDKLGPIVLIAGKNGAGKTRIINYIFNTLKSKPTKGSIEQAPHLIKEANRNSLEVEKGMSSIRHQLSTTHNPDNITELQSIISQQEKNINDYKNQIAHQERVLSWNQVETNELGNHYPAFYFVPKSLNLKDCRLFSKQEIIGYADDVNSIGIDNLPNGTFAKIQVVQDRWFNATHPNVEVGDEEIKSSIEAYEKLKSLIILFLNTTLGRNLHGEATLFGFPTGQAKLSDGQKILLQFCMAIYSQEVALKDLVLILDEPENHLHPFVIIETIERIQKCVSNGQIWIATHSIPLLAHFDPSAIWFVENHKISHAGKIPEKVLHSLLGDENEVAKLQDFISLPAQFASSRYAFESLFEPTAVLTSSNDPQSFQIRTDLLNLTTKGKIRILEFGAGKGRLISNIVDLDESNQEKLIESIDYIAFDKYSLDKEQCENALVKAYGNSQDRYFNDMDKLLAVYDTQSFDIVIMCNVLHEIDPKDWLILFQTEGTISNLLHESGKLLLVEDHQIPIGEKAYQKGFLVLDTAQLKELFKITESDSGFSFSDKRGDGRLKAHHIPKSCLIRIDAESRLAAVKAMSRTAKGKILEIREKEKSYKNGTLHGFWTQQFANAQLNLSELTTQ